MSTSPERLPKRTEPMSPLDVLKWTLSTMSAAVALIWGAYGVFETKDEAKLRTSAIEEKVEFKSDVIESRLQRIENKLDTLRRE